MQNHQETYQHEPPMYIEAPCQMVKEMVVVFLGGGGGEGAGVEGDRVGGGLKFWFGVNCLSDSTEDPSEDEVRGCD